MTVMIVCAFLPPDQNGDFFRGDLNLHAPIISKKTHQIHQKYDFISRHPQDTALIKIRTKTGTPRTRGGILSPPARHRRPRTDAVHGADGPTPDRRTVRRIETDARGPHRRPAHRTRVVRGPRASGVHPRCRCAPAARHERPGDDHRPDGERRNRRGQGFRRGGQEARRDSGRSSHVGDSVVLGWGSFGGMSTMGA